MADARLTLLGGFAARRMDGGPASLPSRKAEALLAVLACRSGEPQPRGRLMALLWGDRSDLQARHSLSQALCSIRSSFGDAVTLVVADREAVALCPDAAHVDVAEFQALGAGDAIEDLQAAAELYRGPLLDGLNLREEAFEEWLTQERLRLHDLALAVLLKLADRQAALDPGNAVATLNRALTLDPLEEEAHRRLIRLYVDRGGYNAAIRHYRLCAEILRRELGTCPEPLTQTLCREAKGRLREQPQTLPVVAAEYPEPLPADRPMDPAPLPRRASIAVMPFLDGAAGSDSQCPLAAGLTHDVIRGLARLRSLFVIARGTVFALGERGVCPDEAGQALGVDYIASGSVQRQDDRITVAIELVETRTARILLAEVFDHRLNEALYVLDEITNRIVASIAGEIETSERSRALLKPPGSLDAWEAHHRGLWHMYRFTAPDNDEAQRFFRMAVGLDPTFARAYGGLSFTHFQNAFLLRTGEREREIDRAFATAGQGLIADDRDPAAHWAMGRALWLRGRQDKSLAELGTAVDLCPNFALGHYALAFVHCQSGDPASRSDRRTARGGSARSTRSCSPCSPPERSRMLASARSRRRPTGRSRRQLARTLTPTSRRLPSIAWRQRAGWARHAASPPRSIGRGRTMGSFA